MSAALASLDRRQCLDLMTASAFKVRDYLRQLARIARDEGRGYITPSLGAIMAATKLSRSTVRRAVRALCALGLLARKARFRTDRDGRRWRMSDFMFVTLGIAVAPAEAVAYPGKAAHAPPPKRSPRKALQIAAGRLASLGDLFTRPANSRVTAGTAFTDPNIMKPSEALSSSPTARERSLAGFRERLAARQRRPD